MVYENKRDWPEKCPIEKLISIEEDMDKLIEGKKVSIRRNDRYADVGDTIILKGHLFEVEDVYPQFLKNMSEKNAREEGFESIESYKTALTSIHDDAVWNPEQLVWAHYLKEK
ncbi:ASCH domain-containing protein [Pseudogracilibacillus sp. ICA-222130]|uniref:ASCH domain-containing protein n=1 Tax=Pseudogracilibacillus sp. ICA-222130 TaxID=3134655 RepID=UPI0030C51880